jgi:hypothetical protein
MMYETVTTFSLAGWDQYGKRFLDSYCKYWEYPIHVYWEGEDHPQGYTKQVIWHDLSQDKQRDAFLEKYADKHSKDYRFNATKFCHKVFAFTDPKRKSRKTTEYWLWLDADIETTEKVTDEFMESLTPPGFAGAYLGRKDWHHSELGFLPVHKSAWSYLREIRKIYTSGKLFGYEEWHDSYIFDQIKDKHGWWYNISQDVPGMHVWDDCPLGGVMIHKKGPLRKQGLMSNEPGYASQKEAVGNIEGDNLIVKTKNCVPDERIQANIHYSSTFTNREVQLCEVIPEAVCVLVSAGPSLESQLEHIRELSEKPNHHVVAVKHALNTLIDAGIRVWGCILLDPRPHVADFIPEGPEETIYLVASMCHPVVFDRLKEKCYYIYHAHVGAGESEILADRLGTETFMISGGCSTAMRGIGVMRCLGFRQFRLFAYDCCYFEPPENPEELDKYGNDKFFEIDIEGRKFWSDAEKVAQAQDFQNIMSSMEDMNIEVYGPGVIPHIWNQKRKILPRFTDIIISG